jgi:hypothetical protein
MWTTRKHLTQWTEAESVKLWRREGSLRSLLNYYKKDIAGSVVEFCIKVK